MTARRSMMCRARAAAATASTTSTHTNILVELLLPPVAKVGTVELVVVAVVFPAKAWLAPNCQFLECDSYTHYITHICRSVPQVKIKK
ncbi:MAG: hypothetical protein WA220_02600 [Candidatus Nitrosopolaris sp.]